MSSHSASDSDPVRSTLQVGQHVRVLVNERNTTPHVGLIRQASWHHKDQRWMYFLDDDGGRKVHKRYHLEDLVLLSTRTDDPERN